MDWTFSDRFLDALRTAKKAVVATGAGVSAESGVPTFRGEDGLWKKFRPEELATFEAFDRNPELVWEWYRYRRDIINKIRPNPGHYAIAAMPPLFDDFCLVTQNVDGLHRVAGSDDVIELHGNIKRNRCLKCSRENYDEDFAEFPPRCFCGGRLRPDVVWFGELLPTGAFEKAENAASACDLFFSVGTSGVVQPAASLPLAAKRGGAFVVEINLEPTEITYITNEYFRAKSGEMMPVILDKIRELRREK